MLREIVQADDRMALFAVKMDMFVLIGVENVFCRYVLDRYAMDDAGFEQSLNRAVKGDAIVHVAHLRLDLTFGQRGGFLL